MARRYILTILLGTALSQHAGAARGIPPPLIDSFQNGYGIVAVTVLNAAPGDREHVFDVRCKVELLVAKVVTGQPLPVKAGDVITVPLSVADSGHIESFEKGFIIKRGTKYYLILTFDPEMKAYTQVRGANSVRKVESFDGASDSRTRGCEGRRVFHPRPRGAAGPAGGS